MAVDRAGAGVRPETHPRPGSTPSGLQCVSFNSLRVTLTRPPLWLTQRPSEVKPCPACKCPENVAPCPRRRTAATFFWHEGRARRALPRASPG